MTKHSLPVRSNVSFPVKLVMGGWNSPEQEVKDAWDKSQDKNADLGFGSNNRAVTLVAPADLLPTPYLHPYDEFVIEIDDKDGTAMIYLDTIDLSTGRMQITRRSSRFPAQLLADLGKQREATPEEVAEMQQADEDGE
jgi:hypothetical protein